MYVTVLLSSIWQGYTRLNEVFVTRGSGDSMRVPIMKSKVTQVDLSRSAVVYDLIEVNYTLHTTGQIYLDSRPHCTSGFVRPRFATLVRGW